MPTWVAWTLVLLAPLAHVALFVTLVPLALVTPLNHNNSNLVKQSKLPKDFDFRRMNAAKSGYIVRQTPMSPGYAGGALPVPPGVEDNWILAQGPLYNQDLSVLMTQDDRLLVWK